LSEERRKRPKPTAIKFAPSSKDVNVSGGHKRSSLTHSRSGKQRKLICGVKTDWIFSLKRK